MAWLGWQRANTHWGVVRFCTLWYCPVAIERDPRMKTQREWFRLNRPTIAVRTIEGNSIAVAIPQGATVTFVRELEGSKLAEIEFRAELLVVFIEDLHERGEPVVANNSIGA